MENPFTLYKVPATDNESCYICNMSLFIYYFNDILVYTDSYLDIGRSWWSSGRTLDLEPIEHGFKAGSMPKIFAKICDLRQVA